MNDKIVEEIFVPIIDDDLKVRKKCKYDAGRVSDDGYIYTPYITRNGKITWHPTGGVFRFLPS